MFEKTTWGVNLTDLNKILNYRGEGPFCDIVKALHILLHYPLRVSSFTATTGVPAGVVTQLAEVGASGSFDLFQLG